MPGVALSKCVFEEISTNLHWPHAVLVGCHYTSICGYENPFLRDRNEIGNCPAASLEGAYPASGKASRRIPFFIPLSCLLP